MHSFVTADPPDALNLTTLAAVKAELGITDSSEDATLAVFIARASKEILSICDLVQPLADVIETYRFESCERLPARSPLVLSYRPVDEIASITVDDVAVTDYEVDVRRGLVYRLDGGWWAGKVVVTYGGGYAATADVPAILGRATIELVMDYRSNASTAETGGAGVSSVEAGDLKVSYFSERDQSTSTSTGPLPTSVLELCKPYRSLSVA